MLLFSVEELLGLPVLKLSPVLALLAGLMFFAKAGILSGVFYIQSIVLFITGLVMCGAPAVSTYSLRTCEWRLLLYTWIKILSTTDRV